MRSTATSLTSRCPCPRCPQTRCLRWQTGCSLTVPSTPYRTGRCSSARTLQPRTRSSEWRSFRSGNWAGRLRSCSTRIECSCPTCSAAIWLPTTPPPHPHCVWPWRLTLRLEIQLSAFLPGIWVCQVLIEDLIWREERSFLTVVCWVVKRVWLFCLCTAHPSAKSQWGARTTPWRSKNGGSSPTASPTRQRRSTSAWGTRITTSCWPWGTRLVWFLRQSSSWPPRSPAAFTRLRPPATRSAAVRRRSRTT